MAAFPSYARVLLNGLGEKPTPVSIRSEMERGVPKQRRISADALVTVGVTALFTSDADAESFITWFYADAGGGAAWFDWVHPRTKEIVQARIVGGDIGTLTPLAGAFRVSQRSFLIEYVRSTL